MPVTATRDSHYCTRLGHLGHCDRDRNISISVALSRVANSSTCVSPSLSRYLRQCKHALKQYLDTWLSWFQCSEFPSVSLAWGQYYKTFYLRQNKQERLSLGNLFHDSLTSVSKARNKLEEGGTIKTRISSG